MVFVHQCSVINKYKYFITFHCIADNMKMTVHFSIKHQRSGMWNIFNIIIVTICPEDQPFLQPVNIVRIYAKIDEDNSRFETVSLILRNRIYLFSKTSRTLCQNDKYLRLFTWNSPGGLKFSARFNPTVFRITLLSLLLCTIYASCVTIKFNAPRLRPRLVRAIRVWPGRTSLGGCLHAYTYRSVASRCEGKKKWTTAENLIRAFNATWTRI